MSKPNSNVNEVRVQWAFERVATALGEIVGPEWTRADHVELGVRLAWLLSESGTRGMREQHAELFRHGMVVTLAARLGVTLDGGG